MPSLFLSQGLCICCFLPLLAPWPHISMWWPLVFQGSDQTPPESTKLLCILCSKALFTLREYPDAFLFPCLLPSSPTKMSTPQGQEPCLSLFIQWPQPMCWDGNMETSVLCDDGRRYLHGEPGISSAKALRWELATFSYLFWVRCIMFGHDFWTREEQTCF